MNGYQNYKRKKNAQFVSHFLLLFLFFFRYRKEKEKYQSFLAIEITNGFLMIQNNLIKNI